jgi:hypothetical protein
MPLTFDSIPYPPREDLVDSAAVSQQQATAIDANFAKINTDMSAPGNTTVWVSAMAGKKSGAFVAGGPYALGANWPAFNVAIPAQCSALIIELNGGLFPPTAHTFAYFSVITGAGITSLAHEPILSVQSANYMFGNATTVLLPGRIIPGKTITITPSYTSTYTGEVGEMQDGIIYVTALR